MRITFKDNVPLKETMVFEDLFDEALKLTQKDKSEVIEECHFTYWMFVDGKLAGETYAVILGESEEDYPGCEEFNQNRTLYVYSTAILKPFQGMGYARILKAFLLGAFYSDLELDTVVGHALEGKSVHLNKSFGADLVKVFEGWQGTEKTAYLYSLSK